MHIKPALEQSQRYAISHFAAAAARGLGAYAASCVAAAVLATLSPGSVMPEISLPCQL